MFAEDDEGTTVVDADGRPVGVVEEVIFGTAFVEPMPSLDPATRSALGWGGDDRDAYRLDDARVASRSASEIRLVEP